MFPLQAISSASRLISTSLIQRSFNRVPTNIKSIFDAPRLKSPGPLEIIQSKQGVIEIAVIKDLFPAEACNRLIQYAEHHQGFEISFVNKSAIQGNKGELDLSIRQNKRAIFPESHPGEGISSIVWEYIRPFIADLHHVGEKHAVGLNPLSKVYKNEPGDYFKRHPDGVVRLVNQISIYSFLVCLNDDFKGGETAFRNYTVMPETGMGIFFVHHLLHEGRRVDEGIKYQFRSDLMYE